MGKLVEEGIKAGWLRGNRRLPAVGTGARVRRSGGKINVTDGPFTESKEVVGGFAILKANSKEEAIQLAQRFPQGCWGRRVRTAPDLRTGGEATAPTP